MNGGKRDIQELVDRINAIEQRGRHREDDLDRSRPVDSAVGPLQRGRLHEWFGVEMRSGERWAPPLAVLSDAASHAFATMNHGLVIWIGRSLWPYPTNLDREILAASVFVDPPNAAIRVWAIDVALRSRSVAAVVADGSALNIHATRRLQLAAEAGVACAMLARRPDEESRRSAAAFRWRVCVAGSVSGRPRWEVTQIRGKDASGMTRFGKQRSTLVEWRHGEGLVVVPAVVADRAAGAARRSA